MIRAITAFVVCLAAAQAPAQAELAPIVPEEITVPSGQPVAFFESLMDRPGPGLTARFRFLAPELAQWRNALSYEELEADMAYLCDTYALPRIDVVPAPSMVVISMSEAPTEFGVPAPDVLQVFEAYRPTETGCAWEAF